MAIEKRVGEENHQDSNPIKQTLLVIKKPNKLLKFFYC